MIILSVFPIITYLARKLHKKSFKKYFRSTSIKEVNSMTVTKNVFAE